MKFGVVLAEESGRGRGIFRPPDVARRPRSAQTRNCLRDARANECPGTLILRLLLTPDDLRLGKAAKFLGEDFIGEWIELLDAEHLDALFAPFLAFFHEIEIDFAGAEDDALDVAVGDKLDSCRARDGFRLIEENTVERRTCRHVGEERHAVL